MSYLVIVILVLVLCVLWVWCARCVLNAQKKSSTSTHIWSAPAAHGAAARRESPPETRPERARGRMQNAREERSCLRMEGARARMWGAGARRGAYVGRGHTAQQCTTHETQAQAHKSREQIRERHSTDELARAARACTRRAWSSARARSIRDTADMDLGSRWLER